MPHFYTIREANDKLPELARLLGAMQAHGQQLTLVQGRIAAMQKKIRSNGHHDPNEDVPLAQALKALEDALREGFEQLAAWNIELKDLQIGLVDFPALREGRTVFLCWQLGEPEVAFWHETTTGFAGRQPLDDKLD